MHLLRIACVSVSLLLATNLADAMERAMYKRFESIMSEIDVKQRQGYKIDILPAQNYTVDFKTGIVMSRLYYGLTNYGYTHGEFPADLYNRYNEIHSRITVSSENKVEQTYATINQICSKMSGSLIDIASTRGPGNERKLCEIAAEKVNKGEGNLTLTATAYVLKFPDTMGTNSDESTLYVFYPEPATPLAPRSPGFPPLIKNPFIPYSEPAPGSKPYPPVGGYPPTPTIAHSLSKVNIAAQHGCTGYVKGEDNKYHAVGDGKVLN